MSHLFWQVTVLWSEVKEGGSGGLCGGGVGAGIRLNGCVL